MLRAVDTNVLARAIVDDGTDQSRRASQFIRDNQVFVSDTVLLETEWLLRSHLVLDRKEIRNLIAKLVSLETIVFDDAAKIAKVVSCYLSGLDLADAMHLVNAGKCADMISFDRAFARSAAKMSGFVPVREP